jgi:histidinol phosphatase-like PHP family hydrolase
VIVEVATPPNRPTPRVDLNAAAGAFLSDMAAVQTDRHKSFGYKRAAAVVLSLDTPIDTLVQPDGTLTKLPGLGPSSTRIVMEVLATGGSSTVEAAIAASGREGDIAARRALRHHFLSRAEALRVLADPSRGGPSLADYRGDLQMHSEWSDGVMSLPALVEGCAARGYAYSAVTDHSHGLPIARGMATEQAARQHTAIDDLNRTLGSRFRLIKGIEANIGADGSLDISAEETASFEMVLAAPHSKLRTSENQTDRLLSAIANPGVHILAHPRGRAWGTRAGIAADWERVFARAAELRVAIEIDGDPSRQDLDHTLAREALAAGCLFALDSDAHSVDQLQFADTALAHAGLAGIPASRIVNCWPLDDLLAWTRERRTTKRSAR